MRFKKEDQQPQRTRTMDETRKTFATGNDARWRGVQAEDQQSVNSAHVLEAQQRVERES